MHVLLLAQYFWPETVGAGVWLHQLSKDLAAGGNRVTMVTAFPNYPQGRIFKGYGGRIYRKEFVDGVEVIRTYIHATPGKAFWSRVLTFGSFCASAALGCMFSGRPDVIYCVMPPLPLGMSAALAGWLKRAPVVVNVQDIYPDIAVSLGYLRNRLAIRFFQKMERLIYRRAAAIVVITESFRDNLLAKGVPPEKLRVIPNWADADAIRPQPKQNTFRAALGANSDFTLIYSGGFSHNTALESILKAARLLSHKPFRFVLVGDGVRKSALESQAREFGLANVSFLPFQPADQYADVLAAADVQLVSLNAAASQMSLPSKMLKIMASGRPILALARPESDVVRLLERARCGVAVDPADHEAVAATIERLAQNPAELEAMGRNAREYMASHFDRRACVMQIDSLLRQVAKA